MKIIEPTLLLDKKKCLQNIMNMSEKCRRNNLIFRPHFKTHQSKEIGEWFRGFGVDKITVSSLNMALYFAEDGWDDITVAFPVNYLEIDKINDLASRINLNLLVESPLVLYNLKKGLKFKVNIFIKIDIGYHRTGINPGDDKTINKILEEIEISDFFRFKGFLGHAGHSYKARSKNEIERIHFDSKDQMSELKNLYKQKYPNLIISVGDTPTCSLMEDFRDIDEIRPGNFVFYDYMQSMIGSCTSDQIAVVMACPVVAKHPEREEIIIYGGGVHFSKDFFLFEDGTISYGSLVDLHEDGWDIPFNSKQVIIKSLSQEHGVIQAGKEVFSRINIGDVIGVLPIHSCLTSNLMKSYLTLNNERISRL
jgi:D-serine deaminase-like pyridoxal phosphate-dependent protein